MTTIAFIGLGNMGGPMAGNLVKAGHTVKAFDLSQASKDAAAELGVGIAASAKDAVAGAEVVVTMLPAGKHVESVYTDCVFAAAPPSAVPGDVNKDADLDQLIARTVAAPAELPIGVVTSLIGAPFFLWLLRREES